MRRHFLFPREDAAEPSVGGDGDQNKSLLRLWLERREQLARDPQVTRHVVFFWDLAKRPERGVLLPHEYAAFFSRVATALIDSIRSPDVAAAVAKRDWLYDSHGDACRYDPRTGKEGDQSERSCLEFELFRDALLQVAELLLPIESDASVFASFFLELRECVAFPAGLDSSDDAGGSDAPAPPPPQLLEAASYALRALRDVRKIRGAFLQRTTPNRDKLADISGLPPPDSRRMSLKQLLLGYNPRKLALSRAFSALARRESDGSNTDSNSTIAEAEAEEEHADDTDIDDTMTFTLPLPSARLLNAESDDVWDSEIAFIRSLKTFPAPRVAVVGPPLSGKTRVAKLLAKKMRLRYLSLDSSVEMAVDALRRRRQHYRSRLSTNVEPLATKDGGEAAPSEVEAADASAEAAASEGSDSEPPATIGSADAKAQETEQEQADLLADLFTVEDLDALLSGLTFPREKATRLLVHFATTSFLAGIGVVMDDVHPLELRGAVGVDFLVTLRARKVDLKHRATSLACAPTSRVVYSDRELAILRLSSGTTSMSGDAADPLLVSGFADIAVDGEDSDEAQTTSTSKRALASPREDAGLPSNEAVDDQGDGEADGALASSRSQDEADQAEEKAPKPLTLIERNDISPPSEPVVPLRSLFADFYDARYREHQERLKALKRSRATGQTNAEPTSSTTWHEIPVLALQSVAASVNQCVETMSGNDLGISRANASRRATPVNLPAVLAPSDASDATAAVSRADQLRCLLFGDWGDAIDRANDQINDDASSSLALPSQYKQQQSNAVPRWRRLSRWREFCPVTSAHEQRLVLGNPLCAATLAGRVYLFVSAAARDVFCAHPLQFLRRDPASLASRPYKVWMLHANTSRDTIPLVEKLQRALDLPHVSPLDMLANSSIPNELRDALATGGAVSARDAAQLFASTVSVNEESGKWLLTDLPLTSEVATELQTSACLPDVVIALDGSLDDDEQDQGHAVTNSAMDSIRAKALSAQLDAAEQVLAPLGVPIKRCRIPRGGSSPDESYLEDALAVILAALDPLAPCVDRAEDGHVPADLLTAPLPSSDPVDESTTTLIASMLAFPSPSTAPVSSLLGETHRFCAVSWRRRGALAPGLPAFVSCFQQRVYAFAGRAEQRAFDRNPVRYMPTAPRETAPLVPLVLLVGVRGSGIRRIAESLTLAHRHGVMDKEQEATRRRSSRSGAVTTPRAISDERCSMSPLTTMMINVAAVESAIAREQKLAALRRKAGDVGNEADDDCRIAVEALRDQVESITTAWRIDQQQNHLGTANHDDSHRGDTAAILLPGIPSAAPTADGEDSSGGDASDAYEDPAVPSEELLTACFALGMFPALVIPLEASENVIVQRRLVPWLAKEQAARDHRAREQTRAKAIAKRKNRRGSGEGDEGGNDEEELIDLEAARAEMVEKLASEFLADQEAVTRALEVLRARGIEVASAITADGSERQRVKLVQSAVAAFSARKDALFSPCYPVGSLSSASLKTAHQKERQQHQLLLSRLASGELTVGKHGTSCPVMGPAALTRVRTCEDLLTRAVMYRDRVYFPGSAYALARFCAQPWAFVHDTQRSSVPPPHALACSVQGAPHTPTTRLSRQLARETGTTYVSPQSAITWARQCLGGTALWEQLRAMEQASVDASQDSATVHAAVLARLQSAECLTRGWVLDNYTLMPDDAENRRNTEDSFGMPIVQVEPGLLLIVDESYQSAWAKAQHHTTSSSGASMNSLIAQEQLAAEFSAWQKQRLELIEQWTTTYGDPLVRLLSLDRVDSSSDTGSVSFWKLVGSARGYVERHLARVRRHRQLQVANSGRSVTCSVHGIPRTLSTLTARSHPSFETFCPVELRAGRYVATPAASRALCVDYGARSFWLADATNLEAFANDPDAFVGEEAAKSAHELLAKAPVDASVLSLIAVADCDFPELKGYCPVTYAAASKGASTNAKSSSDGARANWTAIVKGKVFFRASYEHKVFLMTSEAARRQFLMDPSRYMGLKLPVKLPPQVTAALATNYPGRLEQELGTLLQDTLLSLGSARPKFPGASVAASACVFLALSLQQRRRTIATEKRGDHNDDLEDGPPSGSDSDHDTLGATLAAFERDCLLAATLRRAITPCSPSCGPAIRGVRGLLASSSSSSLPQVDASLQDTTAAESMTGSSAEDPLEEARRRFDAITRNDDARSAFIEYATSAATKKRQGLGIHAHKQ